MKSHRIPFFTYLAYKDDKPEHTPGCAHQMIVQPNGTKTMYLYSRHAIKVEKYGVLNSDGESPSIILSYEMYSNNQYQDQQTTTLRARINRIDKEALQFLNLVFENAGHIWPWICNNYKTAVLYFYDGNDWTLFCEQFEFGLGTLCTFNVPQANKEVSRITYLTLEYLHTDARKFNWATKPKIRLGPYEGFINFAIRFTNMHKGLPLHLRRARSQARTGIAGGYVLSDPGNSSEGTLFNHLVKHHFCAGNLFSYDLAEMFAEHEVPYIRNKEFDLLFYGMSFVGKPAEHFLAAQHVFDPVLAKALKHLMAVVKPTHYVDLLLAIAQPRWSVWNGRASVKFDFESDKTENHGGVVWGYRHSDTDLSGYTFPSPYYLKNRLFDLISAAPIAADDKTAWLGRDLYPPRAMKADTELVRDTGKTVPIAPWVRRHTQQIPGLSTELVREYVGEGQYWANDFLLTRTPSRYPEVAMTRGHFDTNATLAYSCPWRRAHFDYLKNRDEL